MDYSKLNGWQHTANITTPNTPGAILVFDRDGSQLLREAYRDMPERWIVFQADQERFATQCSWRKTRKEAVALADKLAQGRIEGVELTPLEEPTKILKDATQTPEEIKALKAAADRRATKQANAKPKQTTKKRAPSKNSDVSERSSKDNDSISKRNGGDSDVQSRGVEGADPEEDPEEVQGGEDLGNDENAHTRDPVGGEGGEELEVMTPYLAPEDYNTHLHSALAKKISPEDIADQVQALLDAKLPIYDKGVITEWTKDIRAVQFALKFAAEYTVGKPLERTEVIERKKIDHEESLRMFQQSRLYREEGLRLILEAEKMAGVDPVDSVMTKFRSR